MTVTGKHRWMEGVYAGNRYVGVLSKDMCSIGRTSFRVGCSLVSFSHFDGAFTVLESASHSQLTLRPSFLSVMGPVERVVKCARKMKTLLIYEKITQRKRMSFHHCMGI